MNSDLRDKVVGDYIFTIFHGWTPITKVLPGTTYPILTGGLYFYTLDGKHDINAKYPSAFTEPPAEFNAGPKPSRFKKGDKVLVRHTWDVDVWQRRYFSHEANGVFFCFNNGADEWGSQGATTSWRYCKSWVEGEDE